MNEFIMRELSEKVGNSLKAATEKALTNNPVDVNDMNKPILDLKAEAQSANTSENERKEKEPSKKVDDSCVSETSNETKSTNETTETKDSEELTRPPLSEKLKEQVNENYQDLPDGSKMDIRTGEIIQPPFDYGHKAGWENRRIIAAAKELGWDQKTLNKYVNSRPEHFQIENRTDNRCHKFEKPGNDNLDPIIKDMKKFVKEELKNEL